MRDLPLQILLSLIILAMIGGLMWLQDELQGPPPHDMADVEALLLSHGLPVKGFAASAPVDLTLVDTIAPPECLHVMRTAWLARIAIERMAPAHAAEAPAIARAAARVVAKQDGSEGCLSL